MAISSQLKIEKINNRFYLMYRPNFLYLMSLEIIDRVFILRFNKSVVLTLCRRICSKIMLLKRSIQPMHRFATTTYTEHCAACSDQTQTVRVYQNANDSPSKHEDSTQCFFNVGPAGGGPILKQHWVKCSRLLGSTQVSVYTHPSATIIFSPADQGTFSKTAGQSQAYYNT